MSSRMPHAPVILRAGCKVNLHLFLTGVRPDGWHELDSLFIPLPEPHDILSLTRLPQTSGQPGLVVSCDTPGIDLEHNTLTRAYAGFQAISGFSPSLAVHLKKGIPHGAGLGGGSADAAVLLRWLNDEAASENKKISEAALHALATTVGADVPFFLHNSPCLATGIGEKLAPCDIFLAANTWLVLLCPPLTVPTPWAYRAFDAAVASGSTQTFLTDRASQAISLVSVCAKRPGTVLVNDFEPIVSAEFSRIRACKEYLLRAGAHAAAMSGSGAGLFGLFRNEENARQAAQSCTSLFSGTQAWVHCLAEFDGV